MNFRNNKKSGITFSIFTDLHEHRGKKLTKIITLIIDNCAAHLRDLTFKHIKIVFRLTLPVLYNHLIGKLSKNLKVITGRNWPKKAVTEIEVCDLYTSFCASFIVKSVSQSSRMYYIEISCYTMKKIYNEKFLLGFGI